MRRWAVKSNGIGELVSYRPIDSGATLDNDEWETQVNPDGKVLDADSVTLRDQTEADRLPATKQARIDYINERRDAAMLANVSYGGNDYDVSPQVRNDLTSAVAFIDIGASSGLPGIPNTVSWRDANNVDRDLSKTDLLGLASAMFTSVQTAHVTARALKDDITAATTEAAVNAIDWPE